MAAPCRKRPAAVAAPADQPALAAVAEHGEHRPPAAHRAGRTAPAVDGYPLHHHVGGAGEERPHRQRQHVADHAVHGLLGRNRPARRRGEPSPDQIGELRIAVQIVELAGIGGVEHIVAPQHVDHLAEPQPHFRPVEAELGQFEQAARRGTAALRAPRPARRSTACPCAAAAGVRRRTARARARRRAPARDAGPTTRAAPPSRAARPVRGEGGMPPREILHGPCLAATGSGNPVT